MATQMTPMLQSYTEYFNQYCLTPIVEKLSERGVKVTSEEIAGWIGVPISNIPPTKGNMNLAMPNFGGVSSTPSRRGKTQNGPSCIYKYTRGANNGKTCGKPCMEGSQYCKACINKGGVTGNNRTTKGKNKETKDPKMNEIPQPDDEELECIPIEGKEGYFIQPDTGFLMKNLGTNKDPNMMVYGKEMPDGIRRGLTDSDKITIQKMGLGLSFYENDPIPNQPGHYHQNHTGFCYRELENGVLSVYGIRSEDGTQRSLTDDEIDLAKEFDMVVETFPDPVQEDSTTTTTTTTTTPKSKQVKKPVQNKNFLPKINPLPQTQLPTNLSIPQLSN